MPIALFFTLSASGSVGINLLGIHLGTAPIVIGIMFDAVWLAVVIWEYRVLVSEAIRQRFRLPPKARA